jgi:hypothetical protein
MRTFQLSGRNTCISAKNTNYVWSFSISTLFPCEDWLMFSQKCFLQLRCFKVEVGSVCSKWAYSAKMMKHMYHCKENHVFWSWIILHIVLWFIENHSSQGGDRLCLLPRSLFSWVEETHVSIERKPSMLLVGSPSTLFPCETWVMFWKEYFLKIIVFKV